MASSAATDQTTPSPPRAVVLLSGGLDSYTAAACAQADGFTCFGLTVHYGQRHEVELQAAQRVAAALALADHKTVSVDLRGFGGSALTSTLAVPKAAASAPPGSPIPVTYVPARNTILLSLALGWAEVLGAFDIFIGANSVDYSGYPDCRPTFIIAFENLANLATAAAVENRGRFRIHAPLIDLSKAAIIRRGLSLGLDYALTHSCYDPDDQGRACGRCDSCQLRLKGFREAGQTDPAVYAPQAEVAP